VRLVTAVPDVPVLSAPDAKPIQASEFSSWMAHLAPFEPAPNLAVAVSGGRDSMALVLLADAWARAQGGQVYAITVDHGLRPESAAEACSVAQWMQAHAIAHDILPWTSPVTGAGLEAAARNARYHLLEKMCRERGILHLLVGHHRDDQAETLEMRRQRGSGVVGLAGMAAIREMAHARVLRPLLTVSRERITATLVDRGQDWIEDASNSDLRFERARLRQQIAPGAPGADVGLAGQRRFDHEQAVASLAARAVAVDPAGDMTIDAALFRDVEAGVSRSLLANVITSVSGGIYPPRGARLSRLWENITRGRVERAGTLGGCVIRPRHGGLIVVSREVAGIAKAQPVTSRALCWDGRFQVIAEIPATPGLCVDALGTAGAKHPDGAGHQAYQRLAPDVRAALPALYVEGELVARPRFSGPAKGLDGCLVRFAPQKPLAGAAFGNV
jgi:tRNA(Ile)-lysidine synthase